DKTTLVFELGNSEVTETHVLDLTDPAATLQLVIGRDANSLHDVLPVGDNYVITHNRAADGIHLPNNSLSIVAAAAIDDPDAWQTVFPPSPSITLYGVGVTRNCFFCAMRATTTPRIWLLPHDGLGTTAQPEAVEPAFSEHLYSAFPMSQDYDSLYLRLAYTSWITPGQV